ncbi:hypothetical protein FRZ67_21910 [Panacibacter ginsenosidivorans]|uniref:DUF4488 domain-containing protein n=1 Tax=Panacibacter ginsenosidivorans TaxID=1813871 RepID=A0A5B8VFE4_9BACT|nr:hypothetical protein [Panacibacter ginsenosidivorans]QEC69825.1 hypothetical protein FRZ67_21910 [Panacibacter ginsenosidivorans]
MKKFTSVLVGILCLIVSVNVNAQSKTGADYFKGKWSVLIKGTPNGDAKMIFVLENNNDSIAGVVRDTTGTEIAKITSVELKDTEVTLYFTAQGYDVNLLMTKKDDDHTTGSLMSMFDAEGERIKEMKN